MSVVQYAFISLIGLGTSHFLSERYRKKNTNIRFILYVAAACAFGHQHYSILFEKPLSTIGYSSLILTPKLYQAL